MQPIYPDANNDNCSLHFFVAKTIGIPARHWILKTVENSRDLATATLIGSTVVDADSFSSSMSSKRTSAIHHAFSAKRNDPTLQPNPSRSGTSVLVTVPNNAARCETSRVQHRSRQHLTKMFPSQASVLVLQNVLFHMDKLSKQFSPQASDCSSLRSGTPSAAHDTLSTICRKRCLGAKKNTDIITPPVLANQSTRRVEPTKSNRRSKRNATVNGARTMITGRASSPE